LEAIVEFTADVGDMTAEEIVGALREGGYNPDEIGSGLRAQVVAIGQKIEIKELTAKVASLTKALKAQKKMAAAHPGEVAKLQAEVDRLTAQVDKLDW
jgi:hypothetical protein